MTGIADCATLTQLPPSCTISAATMTFNARRDGPRAQSSDPIAASGSRNVCTQARAEMYKDALKIMVQFTFKPLPLLVQKDWSTIRILMAASQINNRSLHIALRNLLRDIQSSRLTRWCGISRHDFAAISGWLSRLGCHWCSHHTKPIHREMAWFIVLIGFKAMPVVM